MANLLSIFSKQKGKRDPQPYCSKFRQSPLHATVVLVLGEFGVGEVDRDNGHSEDSLQSARATTRTASRRRGLDYEPISHAVPVPAFLPSFLSSLALTTPDRPGPPLGPHATSRTPRERISPASLRRKSSNNTHLCPPPSTSRASIRKSIQYGERVVGRRGRPSRSIPRTGFQFGKSRCGQQN